ncbi:hypothetical protein PsYK624_060150 [Phanerochaete sordida]|uniref:Uncharacterized protein n=1 Tax=Phanerochaete sordida TaxID=48140 RepID=A0A9P3G7U3_9APHY|nr:hypothetical protein PsYK624_060150 [Phanerochaete sordida]
MPARHSYSAQPIAYCGPVCTSANTRATWWSPDATFALSSTLSFTSATGGSTKAPASKLCGSAHAACVCLHWHAAADGEARAPHVAPLVFCVCCIKDVPELPVDGVAYAVPLRPRGADDARVPGPRRERDTAPCAVHDAAQVPPGAAAPWARRGRRRALQRPERE